MKISIVFAIVFFVTCSGLMISVSAPEYMALSIYGSTPCVKAKFGVVIPSTVSGNSSTCSTLKSQYETYFGSSNCLDLSIYVSKINGTYMSVINGTYMSVECISNDPEKWANSVFGDNYFSYLIFDDDKCGSIMTGIFVAADGNCYSLPSGSSGGISYRVTKSSINGSIKFEAFSQINCSGSAAIQNFQSSELSNSCQKASAISLKVYMVAGDNSTILDGSANTTTSTTSATTKISSVPTLKAQSNRLHVKTGFYLCAFFFSLLTL